MSAVIASHGASPSMILRGANAVAPAGVGAITVGFPVGTVAGDMALFFTTHGYDLNVIGGWTAEYYNGLYGAARLFSKVLSAADISAGSVTDLAGGSWWGTGILVTVGNVTNKRLMGSSASGNPSPGSQAVNCTPSGTEDVYWFGGVRGNSGGPSDVVINAGTELANPICSSYLSASCTRQVAPPNTLETVTATFGDSGWTRSELFGIALS